MKKLVFDTSDSNTIADSDSVGAYLRASDGTLLTHSDVGGKKALDVSVADGVNVEVDLSHVDDSVRLGDGTDFFTSTSENGDIALDVHLSNTSIEVTGTDFDIRDLSHVQDSIKVGDGTDFMAVNADGSINVIASDATLANTSIANAVETLDVISTAQDVVASPLANRKYLFIHNNDNRDCFIGASGVTESNGFPLPPSAVLELRVGSAVDIEFVSSKLAHEIRTLELS